MPAKTALFLRTGLAAALALGLPLAIAAPMPAVAKDAPKETNSPEFGKVAGPFQKQLGEVDAKKAKLSPDELKAAAAPLVTQILAMESSVKNPLDRKIYGQWEYMVGHMAGNDEVATKGLQNMLDSGRLEPDLMNQVSAMLGQTAYQNKDYARAIKVLTPMLSQPTVQDVIPEMVAEAYASMGQPKDGLAAIKTAIAAREAAKATVPVDWYNRGNRIAYGAKLNAESIEWAQLLVAAYPSAINWLQATQLVRNGTTNFTSQEELDISRLMEQTGALDLEAKYVEREYVAYLQAIDARRYPGEAVRIAEKGIKAGVLKPEDTFVKDVLAQARPRIAADKASLPGLAKEANAAPTGRVADAAGDTYLSYDDGAKADEMYTLALAKGGVDANKDRILTRLGIAQIEEGKFAEAKATLAKVAGPRAAIAQLWTIFAGQKAAGK